jgi:hypothetical protein
MSDREHVLEDWPSATEWAAELDTKDPRTFYKLMDDLGVPFIVVKRERHYHRPTFKKALEAKATASVSPPAPRGRGRPRIREAA